MSKNNEIKIDTCYNESKYKLLFLDRKDIRLVHMLSEGDLNLKAANYVLDHRKIYLLKADDGRTRVIKASANMSGRAWNGEHIEHYEYDDTRFCYEEYEKDFEIAWEESNEIPYTMVSGKKSDDYVEGNKWV